ncbi:hypothetical protein [Prosthecomicrobium sp. N25]|uniref:hypothetical protein n=1 Tax=Prosthecomicrobium sp. N25 TaxID=3129254 RepID=UPI00307836B3
MLVTQMLDGMIWRVTLSDGTVFRVKLQLISAFAGTASIRKTKPGRDRVTQKIPVEKLKGLWSFVRSTLVVSLMSGPDQLTLQFNSPLKWEGNSGTASFLGKTAGGSSDFTADWINPVIVIDKPIVIMSQRTFHRGVKEAIRNVDSATNTLAAYVANCAKPYNDAYKAHTKFVNDIEKDSLGDKVLFSIFVVAVAGYAGSLIGQMAEKAVAANTLVSPVKNIFDLNAKGAGDAAKDFIKFVIREGATAAAFSASGPKVDIDPFSFYIDLDARIRFEMEKFKSELNRAADKSDPDKVSEEQFYKNFPELFSPEEAVEQLLYYDIPPLTRIRDIKIPDASQQAAWQAEMQRKFLLKWLESKPFSLIPSTRWRERNQVRAYGNSINMPRIDELLDEYGPDYSLEANPYGA